MSISPEVLLVLPVVQDALREAKEGAHLGILRNLVTSARHIVVCDSDDFVERIGVHPLEICSGTVLTSFHLPSHVVAVEETHGTTFGSCVVLSDLEIGQNGIGAPREFVDITLLRSEARPELLGFQAIVGQVSQVKVKRVLIEGDTALSWDGDVSVDHLVGYNGEEFETVVSCHQLETYRSFAIPAKEHLMFALRRLLAVQSFRERIIH